MEDRLRKFAYLVDSGSFTAGAMAMHISQPALTVAIHKLERELGATLLLREPRGFRLTSAGKLAYRSAKQLMVATANLSTNLQELAGDKPSATLGLIDSIASVLFAPQQGSGPTDAFDSQLKLSVIVNTSSHLIRATERGDIDMAFITEQPGALPELLEVDAIGVEPMILVCHPSVREEFESQLRHHQAPPFISYDQASTSFQLIIAGLKRHAINVSPIFYSSSPEIMRGQVLRGKGISVLPYFLVKDMIGNGQLAVVRYPEPVIVERPIGSITGMGKVLPTALASLPIVLQRMLLRQASAAQTLT